MNVKTIVKIGFLLMVMGFITLSLTGCGGAKVIKNAEELKEYLGKQPANSPDKPIKVKMNVNNMMILDISNAIKHSGKYVSLDLSPSAALTTITNIGYQSSFRDNEALVGIILPNSLTSIGNSAFTRCTNLASVTIPASVTIIEAGAFYECASLVSVTIPGSVTTIEEGAFARCNKLTSVTFEGGNIQFVLNRDSGNTNSVLPGDLYTKYLAEGAGTYTTEDPGLSSVWIKQSGQTSNQESKETITSDDNESIQESKVNTTTMYVTSNAGLSRRTEPASGSQKVGSYAFGEEVEVVETSARQDTIDGIQSPWYKTYRQNTSDGEPEYAWVFGGYLSETMPDPTKGGKTLRITGIDSQYNDFFLANLSDSSNRNASSDVSLRWATMNNGTLAGRLQTAPGTDFIDWTGSGSYYIHLILMASDGMHLYVSKDKISFDNAVTETAFSNFTFIERRELQ